MKGPVKLSLAIALALAGGDAFALGLGAIQVKSGLNQPLDAEIPVIADSAAEANALTVDLASAEDFERVGLNRSRVSVPIEMTIGTNARGQTIVKLTSKDPVREPLLDFLLVANWPKGKLLREFTVLLDPPVTAPVAQAGPATVAPVAEKPSAAAQPLPEKKAAAAKAARPEAKPPVASAPKAAKPAAPPTPAPAPKPAAQSAAGANEYGPVAAGETLSEIARATAPDDKTNVNQMMLALLKANPKAFYQDNINALKRGAILRIPTNDEIKANGSIRDAIAQVHSQNEAWTGKVPVATPTLVAHTGAPAKHETPSEPAKNEKPAKQERLALVPPSTGKTATTADRAGAAGGTGKDSAELKGELARTKEALTSREQEASELKSRVKQLEDIGSKDQRLISLKDSEIADLQKKLKELQAKATAAPAPAATPVKPAEAAPAAAARPEQKITAKDIWGDLNAGEKAVAKPAAAGTPPASTGTATTAPGTTPATATPAATPAPGTTPGTTGTATSSTAPAAETPATTAASTATTAPAAATPAAPKPAAATTPIKASSAAKITPLEPPSEPFWRNQNVLLGGGAALVLVGLFALMRFMRKPKPAAVPDFADEAGAVEEDEELRLRDALQQNPANSGASLELLRHYYARGDAAKFEAAAETMHAHLTNPDAPEWDEVLAMGAVLAPNHPLFSAVAGEPHMDEPMPRQAERHDEHDEFAYPAHKHEPEALPDFDDAQTQIGSFDVGEAPAAQKAAAPAHDDSFDFDLPMHSEETRPPAAVRQVAPEPVMAAEAEAAGPSARNDDIYVGEDAIGTKLDLAKAYLDMGDPEGARSMLDEVMNEGNDSQKDEARKLLAEIH